MDVSTPEPKDESPASPEHEVGVLFVHGIGRQTRGSTLIGFGEPFFRCLRDRFDGVHGSWGRRGLTTGGLQAWLSKVQDGDDDRPDLAGSGAPEDEHERAERARVERRELAALVELTTHPAVARQSGPGPQPGEEIEAEPSDPVAVRADFGAGWIREDAGDPGAPASATLHLTRVNVNGEILESSWRLAEAWWAPAFHSPTYRDLAMWSLRALPWLIGSHFGATLRTRVRQTAQVSWWGRPTAVARLLAAFIYFLLTPLLILASQAALLVLWLPALIPITRIRSAAAGIQRSIAGTLGDSYVLLQSPIQAAAIRGQVLGDLQWLAAKCEKVAVVAHSQGAAVIYQVMRDNELPADLLVTYGSGLRKLDELDQVQRHRFVNTFAAVTLFGILATPVGFVSLFGADDAGGVVGGLMWGGAGLIALVGSMLDWYRGRKPAKAKLWAGQIKDSGLVWHDIYAADDPVPNGRLDPDEPLEEAYPVPQQVHNQDSIAKDHTTYWDNTDEFTLDILQQVGSLDENFADIVDVPRSTRVRVQAYRRARVFVLAALRRFSWVSAVIVVAARWPRWVDMLEWLAPRTGWRDTAVDLGAGHAAAVGLVALVAGAYLIATAIWRAWDRGVATVVVDRLEAVDGISFRVMAMLALGLVPPIVAVVTVGLVDLEGDAVPWMVAVGMIAIAVLLVLVPAFQERRLSENHEAGPTT